MNILMLVSSMHAGGAERVAATLVNGWSARGDTVTLMPTYSLKGDCFYTLDDGVTLLWLADLAGTRRGGLWAAWRRLRALRAHVKTSAPDVIVSFLTHVNVAAIVATWGLRVPVIACERTQPVIDRTTSPRWRCLRRLVYPYAAMVTVQAEATRAPFAALVPGLSDLAVIANPLAPTLTDHPVRQLIPTSAPTARKRLLAMGRLVPDKQFSFLIAVFAQIATRYPEWDLWIWGEGPERAALEMQIEQLSLASRIQLPGRSVTPWLELQAGQAFVLSSALEGFPNVLLEAMALGLPCIALDCPSGPRDILRDGQDGILVPMNDPTALQLALERLLGDESLRHALGQRGAQSVRQRFSLRTILAQWDVLFDRVRRAS